MPSWITRRRAGRGSRAAVVRVPHSSSRGCKPGPLSTTPYPRTAVPGSMPSTLTGKLSGLGLGQLSGVDIEVRGDPGHVVQLFEDLHELENALGVRALDLDRVLGDHRELGRVDGELPRGERVLDRVQGGRRGGDDVLLALAGEVLGAGIERGLERGILLGLGGVEIDLPLPVEHPGHRVGGAEVAAVPAERVPDLGDRPIRIVGRGLDEDRGTARPIALVGELLVDAAFELARALLDRPVDVVPRHVHRLGRVDGGAEARVAAGVAAARLGGDGDLADDLGPGRGAAGVGDGLLALDLLPLAVAGHGQLLDAGEVWYAET